MSNIWKQTKEEKEKEELEKASKELDKFLDGLYENGEINIERLHLSYREGQETLSKIIMDAIKEKKILLIEAGVGIGKSYGYLLPISYTNKNGNKIFKRIIISTSSIALQEQLEDSINVISEALGVNIKVTQLKGIRNYACIKKIDELRLSSNKEDAEYYEELLQEIEDKASNDRSDLSDIDNKIWEFIHGEGRRACSGCKYASRCTYIKREDESKDADIVVVNHNKFASLLHKNTEFVTDSDMVVFDEAHNVESAIRDVSRIEYNFVDLSIYIDRLEQFSNYKLASSAKGAIKNLYFKIRKNIEVLSEHNKKYLHSIGDESDFNFGSHVNKAIDDAKMELGKYLEDVRLGLNSNKTIKSKETTYAYNQLSNFLGVLNDMRQVEKSNIYSAKFLDKNKISLVTRGKSIRNDMGVLYDSNMPLILLSGTLSPSDYIARSLEISKDDNENKRLQIEDKIESPFPYEKNSLVYYNKTLPKPFKDVNREGDTLIENSEYLNYIHALADEINKLITMTNGKSLILFTSKRDMNIVYNELRNCNYNFNLYMQSNNPDRDKEKFANDENSCLFATGAFWEGIDVKGKSLSNVIICHLPFPVLDPVIEYKARKYQTEEEKLNKVYVPEMISRLKQGTGRLIRSENDTGIVSILDSRFIDYEDEIREALPFSKYTDSLEDVITFCEENEICEKQENSDDFSSGEEKNNGQRKR